MARTALPMSTGMAVSTTLRVTAAFAERKDRILKEISVPDEEYTDLSPKGSIDEGILELMHDVNSLEGLVTTSSCAGRVSVFIEAGKEDKNASAKSLPGNENDEAMGGDKQQQQQQQQFATTGGKGSGRWLFVSHDPVPMNFKDEDMPLHRLFGLTPGNGQIDPKKCPSYRFIRFHWDPMILHVMAASLKHAQPVLSAATDAGFRESGLQSLRCLDDETVCPIIAVRSAGLQLQSIIGYQEDPADGGPPIYRSLVTESYLQTVLAAANDRFVTNSARKERFRAKLLQLCRGGRNADWEDPETRKQRKRLEGTKLAKLLAEQRSKEKAEPRDGENEEFELDLLVSTLALLSNMAPDTPSTLRVALQPPPSLSLPPSQFARLQPHAYLLAHLDPSSTSRPSLRPDGRTCTQFRSVSVNSGSLTHSNGSAVVRIGDSAAVCGVRAEVLSVDDIPGWKVNAPFSSERSLHGAGEQDGERVINGYKEIAALNLLVPNVSLNTGCMPSVQPGAAPGSLAQTLTHELLSTLHTSHLVQMDDLRIIHHPPDLTTLTAGEKDVRMDEESTSETKAFWTLYIDILMLSVSGNPFDLAWAAMIAALRNTRLPKAWWDMDREAVLCSDRMVDSRRLKLKGCPIASSFAVFESDPAFEWRAVVPEGRDGDKKAGNFTKKRWLIADPDAFEDSLCVEKALVVVDSDTEDASKTKIIKMVKNGGMALGREEMHEVVRLASDRWKEVKACFDQNEQ
ncbi:hypothetical protein KEM54_000198 [Ascosphaera aggregata]|nr:hypothetical protein KEM54_000198 [Ascosphaera aggregata]